MAVRLANSAEENALGYVKIDARAGETVDRAFDLINTSDETITIGCLFADAMTGPEGTVGVSPAPNPTGAGGWLSLRDPELDRITLAPGKSRHVPITVSIPPGTPPGDYMGMVVFHEIPPPRVDGEVHAGDASFSIQVVTRIATAVWVRVPGVIEHRVELRAAHKSFADGQLNIVVDVANVGNLYTKVGGSWQLSGPTGRVVLEETSGEWGNLLPSASFSRRIPVSTPRPLVRGEYVLHVRLEYGDPVQSISRVFELQLP